MRWFLALVMTVLVTACAGPSMSSRGTMGPASGDPTLDPSPTSSPGMATIVIPLGDGPYKIVFYEGHQCTLCKELEPASEHIGTFDVSGSRVLFVPSTALAQTHPRTQTGDRIGLPWAHAAAMGSFGAPLPWEFVGPPAQPPPGVVPE